MFSATGIVAIIVSYKRNLAQHVIGHMRFVFLKLLTLGKEVQSSAFPAIADLSSPGHYQCPENKMGSKHVVPDIRSHRSQNPSREERWNKHR